MQGGLIKKYYFLRYIMDNNKNLFSIGQIAESIGITRKIILNYETKGLIQPDITTQTKSPKNRFPGDKMFLWFTY